MNLRGFIHGDIGKSNITFKDGKFYLIDYEFVERSTNNKYDIKDMLTILRKDFNIRAHDEAHRCSSADIHA
jgi:tRNA A-37 threonylcarbamoyl transferase component Bud32